MSKKAYIDATFGSYEPLAIDLRIFVKANGMSVLSLYT